MCCQLAQKGEVPPARSSSSGATTGGEEHSRGGFERKRAGASGGGASGGARPESGDRSSYVQSKVAERERGVERATKKAVQSKKVCAQGCAGKYG